MTDAGCKPDLRLVPLRGGHGLGLLRGLGRQRGRRLLQRRAGQAARARLQQGMMQCLVISSDDACL